MQQRFVYNLLNVCRCRPKDDDVDDARSDDMVSDEELEVKHEDLVEMLQTRIGGHEKDVGIDDTEGQDDERGKSHHANSSEGCALASATWTAAAESSASLSCDEGMRWARGVVERAKASANKSRRCEETLQRRLVTAESRDGQCEKLSSLEPSAIDDWLEKIKRERTDDGRLLLNAQQFVMVSIMAQRVKTETVALAKGQVPEGEPLRWLMHGGPGTGKSHVINILRTRFFEELLEWNIGVHFQIVALQAVMAELLGGDTIHHACGIPAFRKFVHNEDLMQTQMEVAKRVLQWRWLIIDEISMVGAKLLAEVDVKLRSVIREICPMKKMVKRKIDRLEV